MKIYKHDIPILGMYPYICQYLNMDQYPEILNILVKDYPKTIVFIMKNMPILSERNDNILLNVIRSELV